MFFCQSTYGITQICAVHLNALRTASDYTKITLLLQFLNRKIISYEFRTNCEVTEGIMNYLCMRSGLMSKDHAAVVGGLKPRDVSTTSDSATSNHVISRLDQPNNDRINAEHLNCATIASL